MLQSADRGSSGFGGLKNPLNRGFVFRATGGEAAKFKFAGHSGEFAVTGPSSYGSSVSFELSQKSRLEKLQEGDVLNCYVLFVAYIRSGSGGELEFNWESVTADDYISHYGAL